jgi:hypothetical protein
MKDNTGVGGYFLLLVLFFLVAAVITAVIPKQVVSNRLGEGLAQAGMGFDIPNPLELLVRAFNAVTDWYVVRQHSYLRR